MILSAPEWLAGRALKTLLPPCLSEAVWVSVRSCASVQLWWLQRSLRWFLVFLSLKACKTTTTRPAAGMQSLRCSRLGRPIQLHASGHHTATTAARTLTRWCPQTQRPPKLWPLQVLMMSAARAEVSMMSSPLQALAWTLAPTDRACTWTTKC